MAHLDNGNLSIIVSEHGAELQSITKKGKEYLWQADARFWGRHSPVLFPIVGRVWGDVYRQGGKEYRLGQHGFARDMDFTLVVESDDELLYELKSNEVTHRVYPYDFRLQIGYRLENNRVIVSWRVENSGDGQMWFQIGAHPAFNLPEFDAKGDLRGWFEFDTDAELHYISPKEKGCVSPELHTLKRDYAGRMAIRKETFDCDTYIFEDSQLHRVALLTADGKPYLSVEFSTPLVALWAPTATKPDCPFVCIEPWYGRCDQVGFDGEYSSRRWMQNLEKHGVFETSYAIEIND